MRLTMSTRKAWAGDFQASLGYTLSQTNRQKKRKGRAGATVQLVECLSGMHKALGPVLSTA